MIPEDQVVELFAEANPIPAPEALDAGSVVEEGAQESTSERSRRMVIVESEQPEQRKRRRPLLVGAVGVALAAVVALSLFLTGGDQPDVAAPVSAEEEAIQTRGGDETLSEDDFVGIWVTTEGIYVQFNEDGTLAVARLLEGLQGGVREGMLERAQWSFDGSEVTWAGDQDSLSCPGLVARYAVEPVGDGAMKWTAIGDDPCPQRAGDFQRGPLRPYSS